jgi:hypothetical protein
MVDDGVSEPDLVFYFMVIDKALAMQADVSVNLSKQFFVFSF